MARWIAIASTVVAAARPAGGASAQSGEGAGAETLTSPRRATAGSSDASREREPARSPARRPTEGSLDASREGEPARATVMRISEASRERRITADLGAPGRARARPAEVTFDLALATHVPISLGIEGNLVLPLGFLVRGHVGLTPEPYVGLVNGIAQGLGAYDDRIGAIVSRSATSSFVLRLSAGMRPVPGYGFEVLAGYTLIHGGSRIPAEVLEAASGQSMGASSLGSIGISATLHALHAEIGWSALAWDHLVIRGSIGWVHALGADGAIEVPADLRARADARIEDIEADLRSGMNRYAFSPEARLGVGYQF